MRNNQIIRVMIFGVFAIFGIIAVQTYWVTSTWNLNEQEFDQKINYVLYNVACAISEANSTDLPKRDIVQRKNTNYYLVNINSEVDPGLLEFFLQKEMESMALNIDFEYGVYDCTFNQMVYHNYCSYELDSPKKIKPFLPKSTDERLDYYFGVRFPTRSGYLFSKLQLSIFFSVILLLTMLFFAYSMYVILKQNRLSAMQKDFINNMTHEFKTPLSTIKISADVFLNHPAVQGDTRLNKYASIIKEQNQRLNQQVERVLQIARFEQESFKLETETIIPAEILEEIKINKGVDLQQAGGTLLIDSAAANIAVKADPLHLSNILYTLFDNSVKYCSKAPQIQILSRQENNQLWISIKDNGIGIAKEHLSRIFDKFYRVPTGNVHNVKGFGLGLFYVKKICQAHNWKLKVSSTPDVGTTFEIGIPIPAKGIA